jgi:hypothetical protein
LNGRRMYDRSKLPTTLLLAGQPTSKGAAAGS